MIRSLFGIAEIADAIGVSANTVAQWYRRGKLPAPDDVLRMGPVWRGPSIRPFIEAHAETAATDEEA